ncbi:hypothetical protein BH11MYX1_BH11MYX1_02220 [soil metagenome]
MNVFQLDAITREPRVLRPIIDYLRTIAYTLPAIAGLVDEPDPANFLVNAGRCAFLYDDELRDHPSPLALLARLFLLGGQLEPDAYGTLPGEVREVLERHGLVEVGDGIRATVTIGELDGTYVMSDKLFEHRDGVIEVHDAPEAVWPISEWSLTLFRGLAIDPTWTRLLDVGCGTGCVSLLARSRYASITGFDLNPRAVAFARVNAALCGATVSYAVADCLTYVSPTRFDHIVFAAPAGPSTGSEGMMVSYGGRLGHELAIEFMREQVSSLLAPGGCCQIWSIFAVTAQAGSVRELIARALPERFTITVDEVRSGGLYLAREHIDAAKPPPGCHYASGDAAVELLHWLRANNVVEVVSAVVTLRARA